jgi:NAD(P)H-dependent flavin oxidoreductase YrpB (nitropropane dioxygenase family)
LADPLRTPLCNRLGIELPIIQAPIGSAATAELVSAVAEAGGLGVAAMTWKSDDEVRIFLERARALTARAIAINVVLAFPVDVQISRCLDSGVRVISTAWGDPAQVSTRIHDAGALHLHTVGSVDEAKHAADAGVDVIVAQGWEAGGHVRGSVSTMALVPAVVDAVAPIPVIAAGGIGDGRGLVAALALGAQAAWLGTRFLVASEAFTHAVYRRHVIAADGVDAVYSGCFDGGWPDAPHRALANSTLRRWQEAGSPPPPNRPGEGDVLATQPSGREHHRYDDIMPLPDMVGDLGGLALYAGQSAGLVHDEGPAGDIVRRIAAEAREVVEGLA